MPNFEEEKPELNVPLFRAKFPSKLKEN